jgi:glycosyltransferase involved in cell wall biosynthesis
MAQVLHLIDDIGLGGVTRVLADHLPRLAGRFTHEVLTVGPNWRLPPRINADIVVVHFTLNWTKLPFLAALRLRTPRARLVLVEHSYTACYEQQCVRNRARFRTMLRIGYRLAHRVVAVSHGQADWLRQARLVTPGRLVAIPQACDTSAIAALPPVTAAARPLRLGAYGRYAPQKGFDVLIEAMRRVSPNVATLELGGYGPELPALQTAAAELPHVHIGGPIDGPGALLARVDAVVIPSRWEAFGLVATEARAAGRPVIASFADGLVEQIDPSWGIGVVPEDADQLAAAITSLGTRDLAAMGEAARASVATALVRTIDGWKTLLRELADGGHAGTHSAPEATVGMTQGAIAVGTAGNG